MRTTVYLPDDLLVKAKKLAATNRTTLTKLIEDSLRETVTRRPQPAARRARRIVTYRGKGVRPGIDLDDTAALVDLIDDRASAR